MAIPRPRWLQPPSLSSLLYGQQLPFSQTQSELQHLTSLQRRRDQAPMESWLRQTLDDPTAIAPPQRSTQEGLALAMRSGIKGIGIQSTREVGARSRPMDPGSSSMMGEPQRRFGAPSDLGKLRTQVEQGGGWPGSASPWFSPSRSTPSSCANASAAALPPAVAQPHTSPLHTHPKHAPHGRYSTRHNANDGSETAADLCLHELAQADFDIHRSGGQNRGMNAVILLPGHAEAAIGQGYCNGAGGMCTA